MGLKKIFILFFIILYNFWQNIYAGPPFLTDDPEPVDYHHWEYYISTINTFQPNFWTGTSPHFETNYGIIHNVQLHLILPMNYSYTINGKTNFGYAYTELGVKYRFIQETANNPQVGTFPIVEVPTLNNSNFSNGKAQVYLPIWIQKSWGKLTSYGGGGYWINPGTGNKNWIFTGGEIQYDLTQAFTFGGEIYYHTSEAVENKSALGFNVGGFMNFTEKFHIIYSLGHSLKNDSFGTLYFGFLWTI